MINDGLTALLDHALDRQRADEPLAQILIDYQQQADALRPLLQTAAAIEALLPVMLPTTAELAADRERFLAQVADLPVTDDSPGMLVRLNEWIKGRRPVERRRAMPVLLRAGLVLSMIILLLGGTVVLSTQALPGSPLYPLKINLEESRLALAGSAENKAALHLAFAQERADEIAALAQSGRVSQAAIAGLEDQWRQALESIARASEEDMLVLLAQAQVMAENQAQELDILPASTPAQPTAGFMSDLLAFLDAARQDPNGFQMRNGRMQGWNEPQGSFAPGSGNGANPYPGPDDCAARGDCADQAGGGSANGPGPGYRSSSGSGAGDPQAGSGAGPGNGDRNGNGPVGDSDSGGSGGGPGGDECNGSGNCAGNGPGAGSGSGQDDSESDGGGSGAGPGGEGGNGGYDSENDGGGSGAGPGGEGGNGGNDSENDSDGDSDSDGGGSGTGPGGEGGNGGNDSENDGGGGNDDAGSGNEDTGGGNDGAGDGNGDSGGNTDTGGGSGDDGGGNGSGGGGGGGNGN